jgi:hypothetical protein
MSPGATGGLRDRGETRTPWRRWFYHRPFYGFMLRFASTSVAARSSIVGERLLKPIDHTAAEGYPALLRQGEPAWTATPLWSNPYKEKEAGGRLGASCPSSSFVLGRLIAIFA